jgi:hypothetical protein
MNAYFDSEDLLLEEKSSVLLNKKNQSKTANKKKTLKVVSLFSGCGGLDLGFLGGFNFRGREFKRNNFKIEFSNDIDEAAEIVYKANRSFFGNHSLSRCNFLVCTNL